MTRRTKTLLRACLACLMVLAMLPATAVAQPDAEEPATVSPSDFVAEPALVAAEQVAVEEGVSVPETAAEADASAPEAATLEAAIAAAAPAPVPAQKEIVLAGKSGSDSAAGTMDAPVKTFEHAKQLLKTTGASVILVKETVEVSDAQTWELPEGAMLKRAQGFNDFMIKVQPAAVLTLRNIVIDGGSLEGMRTSSSIVKVEGRGVLSIMDGAVLRNNDMSLRSGNVFECQGGAVWVSGTINMVGGKIENCVAALGGGVSINTGGGVLHRRCD